MKTQKYSVNQHLIETIVSWVKSGEIAIPEIQRPFVWNATKVRDLMDSLYQGYPIGYLIAWKNPYVRLKDGTLAEGKKILIDGQQRVTALTAAILGQKVVNETYKRVRIQIAFHPIEERFEVFNNAIAKDPNWLPDIAEIISGNIDVFNLVTQYCQKNNLTNLQFIFHQISNLQKIVQKQIGLIELDSDLEIETVTEIFVRINSQGVVLGQADFAMSKIAANESYGGHMLRKCIDCFCHLAVAPEFYTHIAEEESEFNQTEYFQKMKWLKDEQDDLYDPSYTDLLRVAFTSEFHRGRLADLVSLLSGRNFETRTFEAEIAEQSFAKLKTGVLNFINENNFKKFVMIVKSAGFISSHMIRSQNALNVAYILYLQLRTQGYPAAQIERFVRRWLVLSILKGRYSGSPESQIDFDIRNIVSRDFGEYFRSVENAELSDNFWQIGLVQNLETAVASSPNFNVYLASQVKANDKGFLSKDITVQNLIEHKGDIHHIFPRDYLKKNGLTRGMYNQIANYVYMQSEINIQIGNKPPNIYFGELESQCHNGVLKYGGITSSEVLAENLRMHCLPVDMSTMDLSSYSRFLQKRRELMAEKIKHYYFSL